MKNSKKQTDMSRRTFMAMAGGAASLAAMAAMGIPTECRANIPDIDIDEMTREEKEVDVLVVGSGMAGVFAAVKAHDAGAKVLMVSKGRLGASGQTPFARGIFSYDLNRAKVSLDQFVDSVSRSAMGTNNPVFTRQMAEHSKARVEELKSWGFFDSPFTTRPSANPWPSGRYP